MVSEDQKQKEALVDQYVSQDKRQEAVELLFELVVAYAGERNFEKAEKLNEKLYEVDPMAITEIVRASEAIEEAKKQSLDPKHLEIWKPLYESLSTEEGNALYYAMEGRNFKAGEVILEQGEICSCLHFINKGEVKALFRRDHAETYLKTLKAGHAIGHETFFSATVSTLSMIALSDVKTYCLQSEVLKQWKADTPLLESKLYAFCKNQEWLQKELEEKGLERREHARISLGGTIAFQLLDKTDKPLGKGYKGELGDVSAGGVSFLIKTSRPDTVRMLLGRRLRVRFEVNLKDRDPNLAVERNGQVTAVQSQGFDDYSVHVRFDALLEKARLDKLSRDAGR